VEKVRGDIASIISCNGFMSGLVSAVEGTRVFYFFFYFYFFYFLFLFFFFLGSNGIEKRLQKNKFLTTTKCRH
jgi:hypothetical protein